MALEEGLAAWMRGEDSFEAEAAGRVVAEVIVLHRMWILSHREETK
jgi:hypothetical protein